MSSFADSAHAFFNTLTGAVLDVVAKPPVISLDSVQATGRELVAVLSSPPQFSWHAPNTPFASKHAAASWLIAYFTSIFALRAFSKYVLGERALPGAKLISGLHNILLSLLSAVMFCGCAFEMFKRTRAEGSFMWTACEAPGTKAEGALYFWSYAYYLSKFYEFADTIFLAAKGKPLTFFQVYHHSVVVIMCYLWLETAQSLQFGGLLFNTFVHVIMYAYFALAEFGVRPWWRRYVTVTQIVQFSYSACAFAYTMYLVHVAKRECAGVHPMYFNVVFNMSLLYLFMTLPKERGDGDAAKKAAIKDTKKSA